MQEFPFQPDKELTDEGIFPPISPRDNFIRVLTYQIPVWIPVIQTDCTIFDSAMLPMMTEYYARRTGNKGQLWQNTEEIRLEREQQKGQAAKQNGKAVLFMMNEGLFQCLTRGTNYTDVFSRIQKDKRGACKRLEEMTDRMILALELAKQCYEPDMVVFDDDMGIGKSSFLSPILFEKLLLPYYQSINIAAHDMGMVTTIKSYGYVEEQIENFIRSGFDFWEGQDEFNDMERITEEYRDVLGLIYTCKIPYEVTDSQYHQLLQEVLHTFGEDGHCICRIADENRERERKGIEYLYRSSRVYYEKQD